MREMKDSGIEWIGEVPAKWDIKPIKYLSRCNTESIGENTAADFRFSYIDISSLGQGKINGYQVMQFSSAPSRARRVVHTGDVIISTVRTYLKAVAKITPEYDGMIASTGIAVLSPYSIGENYFAYTLQSHGFVSEVEKQSLGMSYPAINASDLVKLAIPVPPLSEQRRIVSYLDERCDAIDEDVAKHREIIEKLKEYKKSLIAHAVTKGLDPNVEMKDSGVEWIGEMPLDWKVLYPKALFCLRNERMRPGDIQLAASQEYGMILQSEFQRLEGRRVVQVILNPEILKHVEPGDFVMHMRSFQGGLEISARAGCVSSAYVMLHKRTDRVVNDFYKYLFKSSVYIDALRSTSNLIRDGQALRFANFIQVYLPLPPTETQEKIASFLDGRCTKIDKAISRQKQLIEKLGEYRKSIIHHAVTGKIDCTEA